MCLLPNELNDTSTHQNSANPLDFQDHCFVSRRKKNLVFLFHVGSNHRGAKLIVPVKNHGTVYQITGGARVNRKTIAVKLRGLDPEDFWEFFQARIFGENKPDQQYDELIDMGKEIADKLKCSPLAAETVARLLKKNLSWDHWRKVLHNDEWKNEETSEDILPSLKISYDYLPFYLQRCFSYFSLYPEDHRFTNLELISFWTAIGIIDFNCHSNKYLEELVDNGFLIHEVDVSLGDQCFVMHDLMHELSRRVSAQECVNISSLSFSANNIPQSVQHLSITMDDRYDENFMKEMATLKSKINVKKLRSLMIFREYGVRIEEVLKHTFKEIEGLRILFIVMNSQESLPESFSKLIHLRYLKIGSPYGSGASLPSALPRFYHLIFLDLQGWHGSSSLPEYFFRLVNLRHFIAHGELHSNVPEVGKIEHLEELKVFHVKKESVGFELEELGKLTNLGGELSLFDLGKVATKEEASKAKLSSKRNLKILGLVWGTEQSASDADVIDGLQPHGSLRGLAIINPVGAIGPPSWLCRDIPITHLESLTLEGVSWGTLPPFGQLPYLKRLVLKRIASVRLIGPDSGTGRNQSFMHLKAVEISDMPVLEAWTIEPTCPLFPALESIECMQCPNLLAVPFLPGCSVSCTQDIHCTSLRDLKIEGCPKLLLPPMPPAPSLTSMQIYDEVRHLLLEGNVLHLRGYSGAVAFHNLSNILVLESFGGSITSWTDLQKVTSLRELCIYDNSSIQSMAVTSNLTSLASLSLVNCENLTVDGFNPVITFNLKELVVFNNERHPRSRAVDLLSEVARRTKQLPAGSFQLEILQVDSISAVLVAPICSLLAATLHTLTISCDQRVESLTEDEEKSLQLLTSLQILQFESCPGLLSLPQGLHSLPSSLRKLDVWICPEIRSLPKGGLPSSLYEIHVLNCSTELHQQVRKLKETNQELRVNA